MREKYRTACGGERVNSALRTIGLFECAFIPLSAARQSVPTVSNFWNWFPTFETPQKIFFDQFQKANEWRTLRCCSTKCVTVKVTNSVVVTEAGYDRACFVLIDISSCTKYLPDSECRGKDELDDCALKMRGAGHF